MRLPLWLIFGSLCTGCPSAEVLSKPLDASIAEESTDEGEPDPVPVEDSGESGEDTAPEDPDVPDSGEPPDSVDTGSTDTGEDGGTDTGESAPEYDVSTLRGAAESSGRIVGVALNTGAMFSDAEYLDILVSEFGGFTPENATKWGPLQPAEGAWDFGTVDEMAALASREDLRMKGHTLVWHNQKPSWLDSETDATTLNGLMDDHFRETLGHLTTDVPDWDVVNEAFEWDGSMRASMFRTILGPDYIADAFRQANLYAPEARLFYNDFSIEGINAKSNAVAGMVEAFKRDDVPIDGVGLQMHLSHGYGPSRADLKANMERLGDLGVVVHISEMDVQIRHLLGSDDERLLAQAMTYYEVTSACVETMACEQISFWGFTDRYSWVDTFFGEDDPLLYDEDLVAKPARNAVRAALLGEPMEGCEDSRVDNGGFEDGTETWEAMGASLSIVDEPVHGGEHAAYVTDRTEAWQGPRQSVIDKIATGMKYEGRAWVRLAEGAPAEAKLTLHWNDDLGDRWWQFATVEATSDGWVELAGTIDLSVLSVVGTLTEARVYVEGPGAGRSMYVDDISVHPVCPTPPTVVVR